MSEKIDIRCLDYALALLIKPLLEQYRDETTVYPSTLSHYKDPLNEWKNRLTKMINAFANISEIGSGKPSNHDKIYTIFYGLRLFSEHYLDLRY